MRRLGARTRWVRASWARYFAPRSKQARGLQVWLSEVKWSRERAMRVLYYLKAIHRLLVLRFGSNSILHLLKQRRRRLHRWLCSSHQMLGLEGRRSGERSVDSGDC